MSKIRPCIFCISFIIVSGCFSSDPTSSLTNDEKNMPEAMYYNTEFTPLKTEVQMAFSGGPIDCSKSLQYEDLNYLLEPGYLEVENGYCLNDDGTGFVAVRNVFPGATAEMVQWWFWWHANKNIRYKIWCPGAHYEISVKDSDQANNMALSYEERRVGNIHYPLEDVGSGIDHLSIRFVSPEDFGFDISKFGENGIEAVICGVVGYIIAGVTVEHTYMSHVFRKNGDGLELRSRFWLGKAINSEGLRNLALKEDTAKNLGTHCAREFSHLSEFLPEIYEEFK